MTLKARREALFRGKHPHFRPAELDDMRWLWAAHRVNNEDPDMGQEEYAHHASSFLAKFDKVWISEDDNPRFENHHGPVGVIYGNYDGWNLIPHVDFFPWATSRNKVKTSVGFLMKHRFHPDVGCIRIYSDEGNRAFFQRMEKYVPIRLGGKIAGGRPGGPDYIFYIRGKRQNG